MTTPVGIRPQDRLAWHRQLSLDRGLSPVAILVGLIISNHFNSGTGTCFIGMERLARAVGLHPETTRKAVEMLARRGHLLVKRGGGRGWANSYTMVVREAYLLLKNASRSAGVSGPKPPPTEPINPRPSAGPTLKKENSKKERACAREGFSIREGSKQGATEAAIGTPAQGCRIGANGYAVFRTDSPQFQAWLRHHDANNPARAALMRHMTENGRHGEWQEPTEWPPSALAHNRTNERGRR